MGRRFALLIGTSEYNSDSGLTKLNKPRNDVESLFKLLVDPNIGRFQITSENLFINVSSDLVGPAIEDFFANKKSDDLLLLYYAGHGQLSLNGKLHLTTSNTRRSVLRSTSIGGDF